jgi:acylphosphatase
MRLSAKSTKRFLVSGRVQGVCFRASTQQEAERLGICGHALNLADGRVEVLAQGSLPALAELERWLHDGPPLARVSAVTAESAAEDQIAAPGCFVCG